MKIRLTLLALLCSMSVMAQRKEVNLSTWNFSRDGKTWEKVTIPHDWAIAGPFDKKWDLQTVAIVQNGEKEATEKSGRSGALPWIGEGWYKCTVRVPREFSRAEIVFDGAMAEPDVKVNGKAVGGWKYGYNAFRLDITKELKKDMKNSLQGRKNTRDKVNYFPADVEVHLKNVEESSRWYPGAG
ncbi:MAG: beta-galactosidase, partial [Prevotella sp.]|nr:beta-galactosidase [Prevotella sp.]